MRSLFNQTHGGTCLVFQAYFTTIYNLVKTLVNQEYYNLIPYNFLQPFTTFAPFLPLSHQILQFCKTIDNKNIHSI